MRRMARGVGGCLLAALLLAGNARPLTVEAGLLGACRTVQSPRIRDVYGNGFVAAPFLAARVLGGLSLAVGYEFGYARSGTIGLYQESTDLSVHGWEAFLRWDVTGRRWTPYLKAGIAGFRYEQTIASAVPLSSRARGRKTTLLFGAGARIRLGERLFGLLEAHYIPLKVKPFEVEVDLGGWRFGLGLGFSLVR